jgi:putative membrane protein
MLKAIMISAFLMLAAAQAMGASPLDEQFVRYEAQGSLYELAFARLGEARATRPEVRAYATTLVNDHESYNGALRELAESKGIAVPSSLAKNDQKKLDRLAGTRDASFDTAFVREARRVNGTVIRAFRRQASLTTDPDIRRFVTRFQEVEEKHGAIARRLAERSVASRLPVIPPPRTGDTMPVISPPSASKMPVISPSEPAPK